MNPPPQLLKRENRKKKKIIPSNSHYWATNPPSESTFTMTPHCINELKITQYGILILKAHGGLKDKIQINKLWHISFLSSRIVNLYICYQCSINWIQQTLCERDFFTSSTFSSRSFRCILSISFIVSAHFIFSWIDIRRLSDVVNLDLHYTEMLGTKIRPIVTKMLYDNIFTFCRKKVESKVRPENQMEWHLISTCHSNYANTKLLPQNH